MPIQPPTGSPLVSVVIPCYNHGHFLPQAVESVLGQDYPALELLVIDDGSTDHTRQVAGRYPAVRYVYQQNQGLSAARNAGIRHSTGDYLVFLDADDWLYPGAVAVQVRHLQQHQEAALVSGAYDNVYVEQNRVKEEVYDIKSDHYCRLLERNYIGMPAAAMYPRWVLEEFQFNPALHPCEDYGLSLEIARKYPVVHHTAKVAGYRVHLSSMSSNVPAMLAGVLRVLKKQKPHLRTNAEIAAYKKGQKIWKAYYCQEIYRRLSKSKIPFTAGVFYTLLEYKPDLLLKFFANWNYNKLRSIVKQAIV
jgi:glycosyltransferase involved in cell wall biosynthesis